MNKPTGRSVRDRKASPHERVRRAYERGITDRLAIKRITRLSLEDVCEAIALLADQKKIQWDRKRGVFQLRY